MSRPRHAFDDPPRRRLPGLDDLVPPDAASPSANRVARLCWNCLVAVAALTALVWVVLFLLAVA